MWQWLFSHHIFRYVILWEAHSEWLSSKTPGCVYNKGDLLKQGWHWDPSGGGIYLESSRALAKLWSALVLCLPILFLQTMDWPVNAADHRRWPWYPGYKPASKCQLCASKRGLFPHLSSTSPLLIHLPWSNPGWTVTGDWFGICKIKGVCVFKGELLITENPNCKRIDGCNGQTPAIGDDASSKTTDDYI